MKLLVTDTETTGLKANESQVIELAFIMYDTSSKTELYQASTLIYAPSNPVEHVNHISQISLDAVKDSLLTNFVINGFSLAESEADYLVAHNASFDKGFVNEHIVKTKKPWICSKNDLSFPHTSSSKRLGHIAVDHNIPVIDAHRALTDCKTLVSLLKLTTDLEAQIQLKFDSNLYQAILAYDLRHLAKDAGFSWDAPSKRWLKRLHPSTTGSLPFEVLLVEEKA